MKLEEIKAAIEAGQATFGLPPEFIQGIIWWLNRHKVHRVTNVTELSGLSFEDFQEAVNNFFGEDNSTHFYYCENTYQAWLAHASVMWHQVEQNVWHYTITADDISGSGPSLASADGYWSLNHNMRNLVES